MPVAAGQGLGEQESLSLPPGPSRGLVTCQKEEEDEGKEEGKEENASRGGRRLKPGLQN